MRRFFVHAILTTVLVASLALLALGFPVTVDDDRGSVITIEQFPERIVTVGALYAEIISDLGGLDRLVAVAETPDNPSAVSELPSIGPTFAPSVEAILGVEPDLVLGATDWGGERPALEAAGVTVLTTPWLTSLATIFDTIRTLGIAIGADAKAEALIGRIAADILDAEVAVLGAVQVPAAFLYASSPTDPPYTAGTGAIEHELILRAGGANVFADVDGFPQVGFEEIIKRDPHVVFTAPSQIENVVGHPLLQQVTAVAEGRVIGIRAAEVASTHVAGALRTMIDALHETAL